MGRSLIDALRAVSVLGSTGRPRESMPSPGPGTHFRWSRPPRRLSVLRMSFTYVHISVVEWHSGTKTARHRSRRRRPRGAHETGAGRRNDGSKLHTADVESTTSEAGREDDPPGRGEEAVEKTTEGGLMPLNLYGRHVRKFPHRTKGQNYTKCSCPIWCDGELNGERYRRSVGLRDWNRAVKRIERWEEAGAKGASYFPA